MTSPNQILARVEERRRGMRISVTAMSERTGIAEKTYRRRLAAPAQVTLDELSRIALVLEVKLEDLFVEGMATLDAVRANKEAVA